MQFEQDSGTRRPIGTRTGWQGAALGILIPITAALGAAAIFAAPVRRDSARQGTTLHSVPKAPDTTKNLAVKPAVKPAPLPSSILQFAAAWKRSYDLRSGAIVEISVHLEKPSALPPNARIAVQWTLDGETTPARRQEANSIQVIAAPTAGWRKVLHALDSDVYLVYRAPVAGRYTLSLNPVTNEIPIGESTARWREKGNAPRLAAPAADTPWPAGTAAPISVAVRPVIADTLEQENVHTIIACEPNDTPEQAQPIAITAGDDVRTWEITGSGDEAEYFDNGQVGQSGDDWFRLDYQGKDPRLMTAQLGIPNQMVAARVRCYHLKKKPASPAQEAAKPAGNAGGVTEIASSLEEFADGQNPNERAHQQEEPHRSSISRLLKPGETYFLRVEANAPGYQLQVRTLPSAPYTDPKMAVRQGMYQQIGQVDAWLTNRPRGASVERRIRDSGNLLGTQCMSCHTQSGVWGPATPLVNGYRLENSLSYWHLVNVMYECLRPTNVLKDAANNTSLAPLDLGDGPAGTRAAGYNIINAERVIKPSKLHAKQQVRTANFVLQTSDPGGINAAGPGSNVGQAIVHLFSAEILKAAWEKTDDPRYFRAMEEKAKAILNVRPTYTDDVAVRLDFFGRLFPLKRYQGEAMRAADRERALGQPAKGDAAAIDAFIARAETQIKEDEARLRAIQNDDGSWGFSPGTTPDGGKTWKRGDGGYDPSPTAVAVTALTSLGYGKDDPSIARGVKALLANQEPAGRWNKAAQTGFVSTAYALQALSRLYPETPVPLYRTDYVARPNESLPVALNRVQRLAFTAEPKYVDLMLAATKHASPLVRYWALIGLGATHTAQGVPALTAALGDRAKMVREAATWGLRQTLLDDHGWDAVFTAYEKGNDDTRAQVMQTLGMRADAVLPQSAVNWNRLTNLFEQAMNKDPHPAVRAWAARAAWQWWVWNPPVRTALNASWVTMLTRPEPSALVETSNRYSSQALFIVNGHKANGSKEHQYKELEPLFEAVTKRMETSEESVKLRIASRLVGIGGTFYQTSGGDGGPGQMGYVTTGAGEMMGKAVLLYMDHATKENGGKGAELALLRAGLEGGANVPYLPLTNFLVDYSLRGPEDLRQTAASSISDPRAVSLAAVPELVDPQLAQIKRGAAEPPRRAQLSEPILDLWSKVSWNIPKTEEQQRSFYDLIIPRLNRYVSNEQIAAISDPAKKAEAARDMDAAWYLADRLGDVLRANTDLHQNIVLLHYFPLQFNNPLEERFWVQNVEWMLTYNPDMMQKLLGGQKAQAPPMAGLHLAGRVDEPATSPPAVKPPVNTAPDPLDTVKDRALQLYLNQLKAGAYPKTRAIAIRMANQTALRSNPEVLRALEEALQFEKDPELRTIITNALNQSSGKFVPELMAALKADKDASVRLDAEGNPVLNKAQQDDIVYFRDFVMPELIRQKRTDQQACMGCHGLPGRVPSLYLHAPDKYGYSSVSDLLYNYRTLQKRVNLADIEKSKLLRKPLNIQDGKEDGHQGGRRYAPTDPGYLIIRHWVESQPEVQKPAAPKESENKSAQRQVDGEREQKRRPQSGTG